MELDLTDRMVGITMTHTDLKSLVGVTPESRLPEGIWQAYGKVIGDAPVGFFLEVHWLGMPPPRGGKQYVDHPYRRPARLVQWQWVITMTLHRPDEDEDDDWLRRQLENLGGAEEAPES